MKLCMFSPRDRELERGWPGRIEGDRVIQLAAQTLQAFFTGGGSAREHDEFALDDVVLARRRSCIRRRSASSTTTTTSSSANPSCIYGPDDDVPLPEGADRVEAQLRIAAVIGAGTIGGFTLMNDWLAPELAGAKAHDFATSLGPVVVTPDEFDGGDDRLERAPRPRGAEHALLPRRRDRGAGRQPQRAVRGRRHGRARARADRHVAQPLDSAPG